MHSVYGSKILLAAAALCLCACGDRAPDLRIAPDTAASPGDSAVHGAWLNSRALGVLGIDRDTPTPSGVTVHEAE